ncbi:MAG TPA: alpha/beta fold hydrolase, partial [Thermoanaerobaculia bacterium]
MSLYKFLGMLGLFALAVGWAGGCGSMPPAPGSFYSASARSIAGSPGHLIRSEPLSGAPSGAAAWKVLYVSTGLDGRPTAVSGVVIAPTLPAPSAGRPIVAWAHPTTGVADNCAPSIREGFFDTIPHLPALIALDYVVAATDYEGLGTPGVHPYLVGVSEGRSVLDSVRAARQIEKTGAGTRFAVWGHSQGGHAALFTGQLVKSYAPDLSLVGVAAIAPATELAELLRDDVEERVGRILGAFCLWSWSRIYDTPLTPIVKASAVSAVDRVARDCIESEGEGYRAAFDSLPLPSSFLSADAYTVEPWKHLLAENRPGQTPVGAPIYVAQGTEDSIVRPSVTSDFVEGLCRGGEIVRMERFSGVNHFKASHVSASSAIQWM